MENRQSNVEFGKDLLKFIEKSYFLPKTEFKEQTRMYSVYIQPPLILLFVIWQIILFRQLHTKGYLKKCNFLVVYTTTDLMSFGTQSASFVYFLTVPKYYVEYELCYVFEITVGILPNLLFSFSQWMKTAQAFERFIIMYKPFTFRKFLNKKTVTVFVMITTTCSITISVFYVIDIKFDKVTIIDKYTFELVNICRRSDFFNLKKQQNPHQVLLHIVTISDTIFTAFVPFILMTMCAAKTALMIKEQSNFRRLHGNPISASEIAMNRLRIATVVSTVFFVVTLFPCMTIRLCTIFYVQVNPKVMNMFSLLLNTLYICSIPVTFILHAILSPAFRNIFKKIGQLCCQKVNNRDKHVTALPSTTIKPKHLQNGNDNGKCNDNNDGNDNSNDNRKDVDVATENS